MTASELIEKVKALPPSDQKVFASLFLAWQAVREEAMRVRSSAKAAAEWPDLVARLKEIYPDGVPSGPPASQLLHEGRGEY